MSREVNLCDYILQRDEEFYIGQFLIPVTSLKIVPALQRPYDELHTTHLKPMYTSGFDIRSTKPLECVVPLESKDQLVDWVKGQDHSKFSKHKPADMLRLDLPEITFPIIKGQHRYWAYYDALDKGRLPKDAPNLDCLCVRLYHLGESSGHTTLTWCS